MSKKTSLILLMLLFIVASFKVKNGDVGGMSVKFRKVSEDYVRLGPVLPFVGATTIIADEGTKFVKLKLTLKNEGEKDCVFDFKDVYISTEQDSLYRFIGFQAFFTDTKTKIKPHKEIKRIALFEFPDKSIPKELFIEEKRYKIIEEN